MAEKILGSLTPNDPLADRLRKEVAIYSHMKPCAHIIEFIGVYEEKNKFSIVMKWATWGDLFSFMNKSEWKRITDEDKLRMAMEIVQGVEFLHMVNI